MIEIKHRRYQMATNDFLISTLNVSDDMIFSIDTHKSSDKLHILIKLSDTYPTCPCCGGFTKIKDYSSYSYNHLDIAGIPSVIDWKSIFRDFVSLITKKAIRYYSLHWFIKLIMSCSILYFCSLLRPSDRFL